MSFSASSVTLSHPSIDTNATMKAAMNDDKVNKRIDKLEEETDRDIANIKQELNDIKGDFATTFVLREDFFRSMNGVEDRMQNSGRKE